MSLQPDTSWVVVTLSQPVLWQRDSDETWVLNPRIRYVLQRKHLKYIDGYIATCSDLMEGQKYKPFNASVSLEGKKLLVERARDSGLGDLIFLSGPLMYLNHITSGKLEVDLYGLNEKSQVLDNHPALTFGTPLRGPLLYDALQYYDFHWLLKSVTEYNEEPDQPNVYDALFMSMGLDPKMIDPRWKRPYITLTQQDQKNFDTFLFFLWNKTKVDFRRAGYYVVAPHCFSNLRAAPYKMWLECIHRMAPHRPVLMIGSDGPAPSTDMAYGDFLNQAQEIKGVFSLQGETPLRNMMSLIKNATALLTLDTAPLYIAQAFRTPTVSIWGPHDPKVRLRYDPEFLKNAVWKKSECLAAPCYQYRGFGDKCPEGPQQRVCDVLKSVSATDVIDTLQAIENTRVAA